jgi:hypothetical protein
MATQGGGRGSNGRPGGALSHGVASRCESFAHWHAKITTKTVEFQPGESGRNGLIAARWKRGAGCVAALDARMSPSATPGRSV